MQKTIKMTVALLVIILLISSHFMECYAMSGDDIEFLEELNVPEDLNFSIKAECTGHAYFEQASADETGGFCIFSLHNNPNNPKDFDFEKVYIDIYNPDGSFLQELSFNTPWEFVVELEEKFVKIFFNESVIIYDRITQELKHYATPERWAKNNGLYKHLRQKAFTVGEWQYKCVNGFGGYTKLVRYNDDVEELLIKMPGNRSLYKTLIPGVAAGVVITVIGIWRIRRKWGQGNGFVVPSSEDPQT